MADNVENNIAELTGQALDGLGIAYTDGQLALLEKFYYMLIEKNSVMNLTAITDAKDAALKHFADSLSVLKFISLNEPVRVIDIGTGAGFPGIPLKIFCPKAEFVLMDSVNKKLNFINEVIEALGLENIKTCHARAEDLAHLDEYRESFDFAISRAVANLSTLSELSLGFVKVGGHFIAYKSGAQSAEMEIQSAENAVFHNGGKIGKVENLILPLSDIDRRLVFVEKIKSTPKKYPRKAGVPGKKPIG